MSAWIVSKEHIHAMVWAGLDLPKHIPLRWDHKDQTYELTRHNATRVGQMLLDACVLSVQTRYSDSKPQNLPGARPPYWRKPYEYDVPKNKPEPVETLKNVHCYEYQSCEHKSWPKSEAFAFCQALKDVAETRLPGYEDAPWGWEDKESEVVTPEPDVLVRG